MAFLDDMDALIAEGAGRTYPTYPTNIQGSGHYASSLPTGLHDATIGAAKRFPRTAPRGVAWAGDAITAPFRWPWNAMTGDSGSWRSHGEGGAKTDSQAWPTMAEGWDEIADWMGIGRPVTPAGRMMDASIEGAAGTLVTGGLGGALGIGSRGVHRGANLAGDMVGDFIGSGAAQGAAELGAPAGVQLLVGGGAGWGVGRAGRDMAEGAIPSAQTEREARRAELMRKYERDNPGGFYVGRTPSPEALDRTRDLERKRAAASERPQNLEAARRAGITVLTTDLFPPDTGMGKIMRDLADAMPLVGNLGRRMTQQADRQRATDALIERTRADSGTTMGRGDKEAANIARAESMGAAGAAAEFNARMGSDHAASEFMTKGQSESIIRDFLRDDPSHSGRSASVGPDPDIVRQAQRLIIEEAVARSWDKNAGRVDPKKFLAQIEGPDSFGRQFDIAFEGKSYEALMGQAVKRALRLTAEGTEGGAGALGSAGAALGTILAGLGLGWVSSPGVGGASVAGLAAYNSAKNNNQVQALLVRLSNARHGSRDETMIVQALADALNHSAEVTSMLESAARAEAAAGREGP